MYSQENEIYRDYSLDVVDCANMNSNFGSRMRTIAFFLLSSFFQLVGSMLISHSSRENTQKSDLT